MFQLTMVYSDFIIKGNVFSRGQVSSQYNKRSTKISLNFLAIFEQRELSTITVESEKIIHHDFSQQRRKEMSLSLLPFDVMIHSLSSGKVEKFLCAS